MQKIKIQLFPMQLIQKLWFFSIVLGVIMKNIFIKEQKVKGLWNSLGFKTFLSKTQIIGNIFLIVLNIILVYINYEI